MSRSRDVPTRRRTDTKPNLLKQGNRVTHPFQQCVRAIQFVLIFSGTYQLPSGVLCPPPDALTAEGYDMTFGTSVLGQLIHVAGVEEAP